MTGLTASGANMATAAIATLGCKTNQFESAAIRASLEQAGYRIVPFAAGADLVVVNTCTVTAATDAQSRNVIRRARRLNPLCRVIVTGCYAQIDPLALTSLPGVSMVIGNEEKRQLVDLLGVVGKELQVAVTDLNSVTTAEIPTIAAFAERSRTFVQIQNGCSAFCSYCIIPLVRGPSRSAPPDQVVNQVKLLVNEGVAEVVLTGIHVGAYGLDLQPRITLLDLLRRLELETGVRRLRLGSIEPTEFDAALIRHLASSKIICPHLHIPMQSGDDAVLSQMRRTYGRETFRCLVSKIRDALPNAAIGLDVIAGFPGESEAAFANTVALIEELPISHLHVFPYSRRPGTVAADLSGHLPGSVKKSRAEQLRKIGAMKWQSFASQFLGSTQEVVVESGRGRGLLKGLTPHYLEIHFPGSPDYVGSCQTVTLIDLADGVLLGVLAGS